MFETYSKTVVAGQSFFIVRPYGTAAEAITQSAKYELKKTIKYLLQRTHNIFIMFFY